MILSKAYGPTAVAAGAAMLMAFSMVINESLVACTFATCVLQLFGLPPTSVWVPILALGVILVGFGVNLAANEVVGTVGSLPLTASPTWDTLTQPPLCQASQATITRTGARQSTPTAAARCETRTATWVGPSSSVIWVPSLEVGL